MRAELRIAGAPGFELAVRRVAPAGVAPGEPIVMVHGAGGGGVASFDLDVPGGSLAASFARAGHAVYVMDVRGWGGSTRPPALAAPPAANPPAVTSAEAVADISAVVAEVRRRHGGVRVALFGWATGGHWAGMFAAREPAAVGHLVMLNALYGATGPWSLRAALEDPARPGELGPLDAYALRPAPGLVARWEATIPVADKDRWRDPRIAAAYTAATLGADPTSTSRTPPSVRVPSGPLADSFALATGHKLWDAAAVTAPTLIIRGALCFWSRPDDVAALRRELTHAARVEVLELPAATHFVFLDRAAHGRDQLVSTTLAFLADRGAR